MAQPDYTVWPAPADVWAVLTAAGLMEEVPFGSEPSAPLYELPWQQWCDAPVAELESKTDRRPFIGTTTTLDVETTSLTDRAHDPWGRPSRYLALPTPVLAVTSVKLFTSTLYGQTQNPADAGGFTLTPWLDYRMEPSSAPGRSQPYTGIGFFWGHGPGWPGESGLIRIVGTAGQSAQIPAHLWSLALQLAVVEALPAVEANAIKTTLGAEAVLGQRIKVKTEEVEREVGGGRGGEANGLAVYRAGTPGYSALRSRWNAAMRQYRRRTFM